jgi:hypothetical protein
MFLGKPLTYKRGALITAKAKNRDKKRQKRLFDQSLWSKENRIDIQ